MDNIVITDIFNGDVSRDSMNKLPFIIIRVNNPAFVLDGDGGKLISKISDILCINGIDPLTFAPIGDVGDQPMKSIIYVNTDPEISREPIGYIPIKSNVWKPIAPKGFRALNNIISVKKPSVKSTRTINKRLLSKHKDQYTINKKKISKLMEKLRFNDENIVSKSTNCCINPWKTIYGRTVSLTESDSPWYKDKIVTNVNINHKQEKDQDEHFEEDVKKYGFNFNLIACTLLMIVILLIVIRMILNWRRSLSVNLED